VIKSFNHKGLREFFESGSKQGINPDHAAKLARILDRLDASKSSADMKLPGYVLHSLSGGRLGKWSVRVSGNWRVIFSFEGEDAINIDYLDYH